ncbi:MAG TPA: right-handed parallel beta-helix repeat-containing protein [Planctomycetota bacterium]|jgi:hypothetical protein
MYRPKATTKDGSGEKPVATLAKALEISRKHRGSVDQPAPPGGQWIMIHGGVYYDVSVELTAADSNLLIEAAPGEHPVLYGGIQIKNWQKDGDKFYAATLPDLGERKWEVRMLEVAGKFCPRARFPAKDSFAHLTEFKVPWMSTTGGGWKRKPTHEELTTLQYKAGDLPPGLEIKNAEITVYHMWDESCVGVAANDTAKNTLTLSSESGHPPGAFGVKKFVVWNTREGLTAPGQWYHDRAQNRIVYWPKDGQDMSQVEVTAPTRTTILRLKGTPKEPIKNVQVRGLAFSVTTVPLVAAGFAAERFDGAISVENAESCALSNLTVARVAGHGINAKGNCQNLRVDGCDVSFCGAGGIYVGGNKTLITENHVHGVGISYPSSVGIYRGGKENVVSHNEVHDCTYSAINYGGQANIVESNLIYDCMKVLHDGAAIYIFGGKGCILRGNYARDITDTGGYGASAYYLDEQCQDCVVENNFSLRVNWPSHNHMAKRNTIRNNVFVVLGDAKITFPRSSDYTVEKNVLYAKGKIEIQGGNAVTTWSKNLFYSGVGKIETFKMLDYSRTGPPDGAPGDTMVADPQFENLEAADYRFKNTSPAIKLEIQPVDVSKAGRTRR